jgi:hypothetical protein
MTTSGEQKKTDDYRKTLLSSAFLPDGFVIVFRLFFSHPFYEGGNFFILLQPLDGVIMPF